MVKWGYGTIVKISTKQPSQLIISVQKSATFRELFDAFEIERAERRKLFADQKESERAAAAEVKVETVAESAVIDDTTDEAQ